MTVSSALFNRVFDYSGTHSSWAVWASPDGTVPVTTKNLQFLPTSPELLNVLRTDVVTVALNRGGGTTGVPLSTFHTSGRSRDHVLGEALRTTRAWGAYMTDLDTATVDSDSQAVVVGASDVARLLERVDDVLGDHAGESRTYVLLGSKVRDAFADYTKSANSSLHTVELLHYSGFALRRAKDAYERVTGLSSDGLSQGDAYVRYVRARLSEA